MNEKKTDNTAVVNDAAKIQSVTKDGELTDAELDKVAGGSHSLEHASGGLNSSVLKKRDDVASGLINKI